MGLVSNIGAFGGRHHVRLDVVRWVVGAIVVILNWENPLKSQSEVDKGEKGGLRRSCLSNAGGHAVSYDEWSSVPYHSRQFLTVQPMRSRQRYATDEEGFSTTNYC